MLTGGSVLWRRVLAAFHCVPTSAGPDERFDGLARTAAAYFEMCVLCDNVAASSLIHLSAGGMHQAAKAGPGCCSASGTYLPQTLSALIAAGPSPW